MKHYQKLGQLSLATAAVYFFLFFIPFCVERNSTDNCCSS